MTHIRISCSMLVKKHSWTGSAAGREREWTESKSGPRQLVSLRRKSDYCSAIPTLFRQLWLKECVGELFCFALRCNFREFVTDENWGKEAWHLLYYSVMENIIIKNKKPFNSIWQVMLIKKLILSELETSFWGVIITPMMCNNVRCRPKQKMPAVCCEGCHRRRGDVTKEPTLRVLRSLVCVSILILVCPS